MPTPLRLTSKLVSLAAPPACGRGNQTSAPHPNADFGRRPLLPNGLPQAAERPRRRVVVRERGVLCASGKARRYAMGEFTEKAKGLANEAAGKAKQAGGKATDNERLRAEGEAQERKG